VGAAVSGGAVAVPMDLAIDVIRGSWSYDGYCRAMSAIDGVEVAREEWDAMLERLVTDPALAAAAARGNLAMCLYAADKVEAWYGSHPGVVAARRKKLAAMAESVEAMRVAAALPADDPAFVDLFGLLPDIAGTAHDS
jgi:hypothetical protein